MKRSRLLLLFGGSLVFICGGALWVLWSRCGFNGCPDVEALNGYVPEEASLVVDRNGGKLGHLYRVNRVIVPLDSLPPYLPKAFIAVEDQRFWNHNGVDWRRVIGAAWANLRARRVEEGFSTITMQLARNVFPKRIPQAERTLGRKLTEMRVAGEIERHFTKRQILELYLNQIYFGDGAWGIEAAAQQYFGRPASKLTLGEASALAGLIRAPQRLNPRRAPKSAQGRRGIVLEKMVEQGMITAPAAQEAAAEPLRVRRSTVSEQSRSAYFLEEVRQEMEQELGEALYTEGYLIHTTLDPAVQEVAEAELEAQLERIESGKLGAFRHPRRSAGAKSPRDSAGGEETSYLQGAVVVMDTETGDLLALVGGRDFGDSKFDRAIQAWRQPGSAFKPFVYGAALAAGYPPTSLLSDTPLRRVLPDGKIWEPRNFEGSYRGTITMRTALTQSRNVATIRLAEEVGLDKVIDFARRLGLSGPIPAVPSIAIGAAEVTLLELTTAYATIATLGRRPTPRLVTRVVDRSGRVIWKKPVEARRALDPAVAFLLTDLMRDVVDRGTGTPARAAGFRAPAAGKTGTTNDGTDVWFLGFTPGRVAGVWIGFDRPQTIVPGGTGGRLAAPIWGRIMRRTMPPGGEGWTPPPGIERHWVDAAGRIYREGCPSFGEFRAEYFLAGTTPPDGCAIRGGPLLGQPLPGTGGWPDSGLVLPDSVDGLGRHLHGRHFGPDHDSGKGPPRAEPGHGTGGPPDSGLVVPHRPGSGEEQERDQSVRPDTATSRGTEPPADTRRSQDSRNLLGKPAPKRGGASGSGAGGRPKPKGSLSGIR